MAPSPPTIDISELISDPTGPAGLRVTEEIDAACADTGFFVVVGHGLEAPMAAAFEAARAFFALPQAEKEGVPRVERYGFVAHPDLAIDPARAGDNTEYVDMGLGDEVPLPSLDGFEASVRTYQRAALEVAAVILGSFARALELDPGFFAAHMRDPQCRLRFLHYLPTPPGPDGALRVLTTPHTDYGLITLLATDGVPGLEVKPIDGEWTPVAAPAGSLVVNLGDMLARWTNHRYVSTPHRVIGSPDRERISIPFFANPESTTQVACIPSCVTAANPCRYEPVTAGEFLAARIDSRAEPYVDPSEGPTRSVER